MNDVTFCIAEGFEVSAGRAGDAWYAGALVRPDRDLAFREAKPDVAQERGDGLREGATLEAWMDGVAGPPQQRICLVTMSAGGIETTELAAGPGGPVVACRQMGPRGHFVPQDSERLRRNTMKTTQIVVLAIGFLACGAGAAARAAGPAATSPGRPAEAQLTPSATGSETAPAKEMALDLGAKVRMEFVWIEVIKGWVGKYEVTNEEYRRFKPRHSSREYSGHGTAKAQSLDGNRLPVCYVSYTEGVAFAEWVTRTAAAQLPAGHVVRLPDGNEWTTYAQCGDGRKFPWGNDWPPAYGNYRDETGHKSFAHWDRWIEGYDDGFAVACPVEKSGRNDWGLYGVGGNVWELTSDAIGDKCVMRGGSWHRGSPLDRHGAVNTVCSVRRRYGRTHRDSGVGFRLVMMPATTQKASDAERPTGPAAKERQATAAQPETPATKERKTPSSDASAPGPILKRIVSTKKRIGEKWAGIPGIELTKKGRLLVVFSSGGDKEPLPENVIYLTTSEDGGATFAKPVKVVEGLDGARAYDPTLWIAPNGQLWLIYNRSNPGAGLQGVFARTCADPDASELKWSDEFRVGFEGHHAKAINKPIALSTGEWVMPAMHVPQSQKWPGKRRFQGVGISTDQGRTWALHGAVEAPGWAPGENMIVERKDKSLVMYIRCKAGVIWRSESQDCGKTWSKGGPTKITNPGSRFHIRRLSGGQWLLINSPDPKKRTAIVARLSRDEGATWSLPLVLDERLSVSYPDAAVAPDGTIYAVHDRSRKLYGEILLSVFTKDAFTWPEEAPDARSHGDGDSGDARDTGGLTTD